MLDNTISRIDGRKFQESANETVLPKQHREWSPYMNNEGTVMAFATKDKLYIAADKRLSMGYSILSRNSSKIFKLTDRIYLTSSGMYADMLALVKNLRIRIDMYKSQTKRDPDLQCVAQLLSVTLYSKRFFPYYTFNLLCGLSNNGELKVYGYDAVGSWDEVGYAVVGSGKDLIFPVMDKFVRGNSNLNEDQSKNLILVTMNGCANRDIHTGDRFELLTMDLNGKVNVEEHELRKD